MLEHYQRQLSRLKVLLVSDIPIGRHHHIETCLFGSVDQLTVFELLPAACPCFLYGMAVRKRARPRGVPLSKRINIPALV
jgi:hypothetical protein